MAVAISQRGPHTNCLRAVIGSRSVLSSSSFPTWIRSTPGTTRLSTSHSSLFVNHEQAIKICCLSSRAPRYADPALSGPNCSRMMRRGELGRQSQRSSCMRKPVKFLLLLACLVSACATPHWVKPEASKSDLAQDQTACVQAVQQPPPAGTTDQQQYVACMNA